MASVNALLAITEDTEEINEPQMYPNLIIYPSECKDIITSLTSKASKPLDIILAKKFGLSRMDEPVSSLFKAGAKPDKFVYLSTKEDETLRDEYVLSQLILVVKLGVSIGLSSHQLAVWISIYVRLLDDITG
jgi:hypothetical protein